MEIGGISRYFVAIIPPSPIAEEIHHLKKYCREKFNTKAALNSPPHLTLHMPFQWKEAKEEKLVTALQRFADAEKPFEILASRFGCFEPRVIYVAIRSSIELNHFQGRLQRSFRKELNIFHGEYRDQPFHPHITIAFRDLRKPMFAKAWEEFSTRNFEAFFLITSVALLKHDGKRWEVLHEFELKMTSLV